MTDNKSHFAAERKRLLAHAKQKSNWKHWGPYLAERAWGTVREDYSSDGNAWDYFPHEHARSRTYRWNEDGLAGFCDRNQFMCFGLALWNGQDPFLKERLFGLSGPEGNHGEDVKELYWYLDSTPTHSYARMCYRYPHQEFPYADLVNENASRGRKDREYEISDTGVYSDNRYFDITVTYAKAHENDLLIRIDVANQADTTAKLTVLPQIWFRNTWSWGYPAGPQGNVPTKPKIRHDNDCSLTTEHDQLGQYHLYWQGSPKVILTENETNESLLFGTDNKTPWVKDAFHRYIVDGDENAIKTENYGTKAGLQFQLSVKGNATRTIQLRLTDTEYLKPFSGFKPMMDKRKSEADVFFQEFQTPGMSDEHIAIQRQALAGMLWSKQLYYYNVDQWLNGDPEQPTHRHDERNKQWHHMNNFDIMSMPDKWEYPWYAVWDTAFHCLPLAMVDNEYAKRQLLLITREWYMHPSGQLPAYEWSYGDVNPPVHAWASWNVYNMEKRHRGSGDMQFLESVFHKLLLNFTWWVNQKDSTGNSIFEGGFLGLDNISLFDRSEAPPTGGTLHQSDGTAWMGFFSASMLRIALELSRSNPTYQDIASKFFDHYLHIAHAINGDDQTTGLWDETDGFFYDRLDLPDGSTTPIKVRSLVGLMPMIAATIIEADVYHEFPDFSRRMTWYLERRPDVSQKMTNMLTEGESKKHLLSFISEERLKSVLQYLLDEEEFLSPYGIRSLSKYHAEHPFTYETGGGEKLCVGYEPGEGETNMFGGNSNWRGPIWFPINYLLVEALREYHGYFGSSFSVECPTGSGITMNLNEVADDITSRLVRLFELTDSDQRAWCGDNSDLLSASKKGMHQFFEYFHAENGEGLGASHQTGWTGLIALLLQNR